MNYILDGYNLNMPIDLSEEDILKIIKSGLKYLVKNKEETEAKALLINKLID